MVAAVRCAARRLGGSLLQRTQAAVGDEGRWLVPNRFMRSRQLSTKPTTQGAVADEGRRLVPSRFMRSRQLSTKPTTQAAVADEGRGLVPSRFMRSRQLSTKPTTQGAVADEGRRLVPSRFMRSRQLSTKHAADSTRPIQHKEEELYGVLSKANGQLLSAQAAQSPVEPLPWKVYSKRARGVLNLACKVTAYVYASAFLLGITGTGKMLVSEDEIEN